MNVSNFIKRPVLSTVISIFIVIFGILGLMSLPIEQYPDIAPPTIQVSTTYTGANAEAVLKSVIAPLEEHDQRCREHGLHDTLRLLTMVLLLSQYISRWVWTPIWQRSM